MNSKLRIILYLSLCSIIVASCTGSRTIYTSNTNLTYFKCPYAELYIPVGYKLDSLIITNYPTPIRYQFIYPNGNYIYIALGPTGDLFLGSKIDTTIVDNTKPNTKGYSNSVFPNRTIMYQISDVFYEGFETGKVNRQSYDTIQKIWTHQIITSEPGREQNFHNYSSCQYTVAGYSIKNQTDSSLFELSLKSIEYHDVDFLEYHD